jgi:hypothetical protein
VYNPLIDKMPIFISQAPQKINYNLSLVKDQALTAALFVNKGTSKVELKL